MTMLKIAVRNLQRNRRRTVITLAALVFGVAAMIGVKGFIRGFRGNIIENQVEGVIGAVQVHKKGYLANVLGSPLTLDMADTPTLRAAMASVPGVTAVSPRIDFGAQFSTPDRRPPPDDGSDLPEADKGTATFLMVTAFDPTVERKVTPARWRWVENARGQMVEQSDSPDLVLNDDFARSLQTEPHAKGAPLPPVEQQFALVTADRDASLNGENVVVSGTFGSVTANDRRVGFMGLATAQRLLRMDGRVTEYGLSLAPGAKATEVRDALEKKLGPDYEVNTWDERVPFLRDLVMMQDLVFDIVSNIFLFVVLLGIVNAMLMSVMERVREIGTMLAVGMRRRSITRLFVMEGLVLGAVGGLLGTLAGLALVFWLDHLGIKVPAPGARVPTVIHPNVEALFVLRSFMQAVVGTSLAALWPAWRASKLKPVEALAHT